MGILSGMLVVFCVRLITGKKISWSAQPKSENDMSKLTDQKKEQAPATWTGKLFLKIDLIKAWIAKTLRKK